MIWVTWRQHRAQILVTAGFLAVLGLLLLGSGVEAIASGDDDLSARYDAVYSVFGWLPLVLPALVGAFWGAPLLGREYERGTFRLAWTQAVPARRWLLVKLGVLGGALVAAGLLLSGMVSLWRPVFRDDSAFGNVGVFNMVGVAPAAWWLFAFTLGACAGALLRRTLPAMAVVVAGVAVTMFTLFALSDHYAAPVRAELTGTVTLGDPDMRLVSGTWVDPSGRDTERPEGCALSGRSESGMRAWEQCLFAKGYRYAVTYHPPARFWQFQWTEAGILLLASGALVWVTLRRTGIRGRRPGLAQP